MSIKKAYVDLITFLESNNNKKVSSILEEVKSMCESKKTQTSFIKDKDDNVIAIFCYYHKQWELLVDVEYGKKKNSTTGFNTMCKVGTSKWTKKQRDASKCKDEIITKVQSGDIPASEITKHLEDIEVVRLTMDTTDMPKGYTNEEDLQKSITDK